MKTGFKKLFIISVLHDKNIIIVHIKNDNNNMKRLSMFFYLVFICLLFLGNGDYVFSKEYKNSPNQFVPPFEITQDDLYDKTPLQAYNGKIYHIFFHSLILDSKAAFKSSSKDGFNYWMTTRSEFKKILDNLYQNNFILIDIASLIDSKGNKTMLSLPKGKKPLIISIDDVNYYDYMGSCGFADRLVALKDGTVACVKKTHSGEIIDQEGDVMPILDNFVKAHPDFSFRGAKGIVAVTGFQGVFGYRLYNLKGNPKLENINSAKRVANALKRNGWKIACHSYNHSNKFKDGSISLKSFSNDLKKWQTYIQPITGKTNIYIPPFGIGFLSTDSRMQFLKANGYNIFCPVYKNMAVSYQNKMLISERLNFDGFTMIKHPERIKRHFFDPSSIIDCSRPKMK